MICDRFVSVTPAFAFATITIGTSGRERMYPAENTAGPRRIQTDSYQNRINKSPTILPGNLIVPELPSQISKNKRIFIPEFEGLRGLLAAWVVFGHILLVSGFTYQDGWFGILFSPVLGVYAFMMLSGFVITAALDQRPSSWTAFMTRRFFRLFPVYAFCILLAIVLFDMSVFISQSPTLTRFGPENLARLKDVEANFGLYLLADTTLLQCLLPRFWYPYATETFLPPTWSLTIEWLFYMVAPFLIWMFNRKKSVAALSIGIGLLLLIIVSEQFAAWNYSFNTSNAFHFLTGIGSYYLWKHLPNRTNCVWSKIAFWGGIAVAFLTLNLPYKIWIAMMAVILYPRVHSGRLFFLEWPRRVLNSKPLQYIGRTSYVTYLLHWIIIELVIFWLIQFAPEISGRFMLATICTVSVYPLTYFCAHLIHKYLEVPCIRFSKRQYSTVSIEPLPTVRATAG